MLPYSIELLAEISLGTLLAVFAACAYFSARKPSGDSQDLERRIAKLTSLYRP